MATKDKVPPRSYRFSPQTLKAIEAGAERFGMTKTDWIEFLALSAVSPGRNFRAVDESSVEIITKGFKNGPRVAS